MATVCTLETTWLAHSPKVAVGLGRYSLYLCPSIKNLLAAAGQTHSVVCEFDHSSPSQPTNGDGAPFGTIVGLLVNLPTLAVCDLDAFIQP